MYGKYLTTREMMRQLRRGAISLPPLSLSYLETDPAVGLLRPDALLEASWGKKSARFFVEFKSLSTPKSFQAGLDRLKSISLPRGYLPLLLLPFLSEGQLRELEREGVSGIDLCGNGIVVAPGSFSVFRGGGPNLFSSSAPIKNVYRKNSSLVGRVFLVRSSFNAVSEIREEINRRNLLVSRDEKAPMSLSTVSKVLKTMGEDLVVTRASGIRLLQPEKLLEKLTANYSPPEITERLSLKVPELNLRLWEMNGQSKTLAPPLIAAGLSSINRYAVMQRGEVLSVYCPSIERLRECLPGSREDRFPNLEIVETEDETVYFDGREEDGLRWASPTQAYLELMAGDKRDRETAEQVKSFLLRELGWER